MSFRDGVKQNLWAFVALVAAFFSRSWLKSTEVEGLPRLLIAWLPLLPAGLYLRTLFGWARGLDEMQQRIQLEALCFGSMGMLFIALAVDLLRAARLMPPLYLGWEGFYAFTFILYVVGLVLANRHYR